MPLTGNVEENIHELVHHGKKKRPHKQIVAIAISEARRHGKYKNSRLEHFVQSCVNRKKSRPSREQTEPLKTQGLAQPMTLARPLPYPEWVPDEKVVITPEMVAQWLASRKAGNWF